MKPLDAMCVTFTFQIIDLTAIHLAALDALDRLEAL